MKAWDQNKKKIKNHKRITLKAQLSVILPDTESSRVINSFY